MNRVLCSLVKHRKHEHAPGRVWCVRCGERWFSEPLDEVDEEPEQVVVDLGFEFCQQDLLSYLEEPSVPGIA